MVSRAHKDVMIGARYKTTESSTCYCDYNRYYQDLVSSLILAEQSQVSGRGIIEKICNKRKKAFAVNIGLIQKLVNMTVKYLYVINASGLGDIEIEIVKSDCDCPLDSKIIGQLSADTGNKYKGWIKLDNLDEYRSIQDDIQSVILKNAKYAGESRLEYDFVNWGLANDG